MAPGVRGHSGASGEQRCQVRKRPAMRQDTPADVAIEADLLEHPAHHFALDGCPGRAHLVLRHRVVGCPVDEVGDGGPRRGNRHLVGQRAGVVQPHRRVEGSGTPLRERRLVPHRPWRIPAVQLELVGEDVGVGLCRKHPPAPVARLRDVVRDDVDRGGGGNRVVVHGGSMRPQWRASRSWRSPNEPIAPIREAVGADRFEEVFRRRLPAQSGRGRGGRPGAVGRQRPWRCRSSSPSVAKPSRQTRVTVPTAIPTGTHPT